MRSAYRTRQRRSEFAPVRLVGYVRVSTEEQVKEGVSLAAQVDRLKNYCAAMGFELATMEADEGISGKIAPERRPAFARALDAVRKGSADGIVALKLDRLSRSVRHVLDLVAESERNRWRLVSVSEQLDTATACGRMIVTILAALAQMEREQIGERTQLGMQQLAREGRRRSGRPPFGFKFKGDSVVKSTNETPILGRIVTLQRDGMGARRIAAQLTNEGIVNPRTAGPWTFGTVAAILRTRGRLKTSTSH
jgi:site-specific DNA recombinase